jgi:hypothetical protein
VIERWDGLRAAVSAAAQPFTGKEKFALSVMYLHDVTGAEAALDRALDEVRKSVPDIPLHGAFVLTEAGPASEVSWWVSTSKSE